MSKLIDYEQFQDSFYIVCNCGGELIRLKIDYGDLWIDYFGDNCSKRDTKFFQFESSKELERVVNALNQYLYKNDAPVFEVFKEPQKRGATLVLGQDEDFFTIQKYNFRKRKCAWEILLTQIQVELLLEELRKLC